MTRRQQAGGRALEAGSAFVLRTPLLPLASVYLSAALEPADEGGLRAFCEVASTVSDGIWAASRDGGENSAKVLANVGSDPSCLAAARKYALRMATRATPFGLFAGWSTGRIGRASRFTVPSPEACRRVTYPDAMWLEDTIACMTSGDQVTLVVNPAARALTKMIVIPESSVDHGLEIVRTSILDAVLRVARVGISERQLVHRVLNVLGRAPVHKSQVEEFVQRLRKAIVLVPVQAAYVTVPHSGRLPVTRALGRGQLRPLGRWLRAADLRARDGRWPSYVAISEGVRRELTCAHGTLRVHVDLLKPGTPTLARSTAEALVRTVEQLSIYARRRHERALADVVSQLRNRYDERFVPLLKVLDEDTGVRWASGSPTGVGSVDATVVVLLASHGSVTCEPLRIPASVPSEEELDQTISEGLSILASVGHSDAGAVVVLKRAFGPSCSRMLARFCRSDRRLLKVVRGLLVQEEEYFNGAVCADVVYLPRRSIANAVIRPSLREYEIVCNGTAGVSQTRQIGLADLEVACRAGRVVLRSRRLGREVVARVGSALSSFESETRAFQFFSILQEQSGPESIYWHWGSLGVLPRLPRVTIGSVIVSCAQWNATAQTIRGAHGPVTDRDVEHWREVNEVPDVVVMCEADRELMIDFRHRPMREVFRDEMRRGKHVRLAEMLPSAEQLTAADDGQARYVSEVVVPCVRRRSSDKPRRPAAKDRAKSSIAKSSITVKPLGSEWTYAKIYCARRHSDRLIAREIAPAIESARQSGHVVEWFFVRYQDPRSHLRVRIRGEWRGVSERLVPRLSGCLTDLERGLIVSDYAWCTYEPETERYGGAQIMGLAEAVFCADTRAIVEILQRRWAPTAEDRLIVGAVSVTCLLRDFGYDASTLIGMLQRLRDRVPCSAVERPVLRGNASRLMRTMGRRLAAEYGNGAQAQLARVFAPRSAICSDISARLQADASGAAKMGRIVADMAHMSVNRVLSHPSARSEYVLYDVAQLALRAESARSRS